MFDRAPIDDRVVDRDAVTAPRSGQATATAVAVGELSWRHVCPAGRLYRGSGPCKAARPGLACVAPYPPGRPPRRRRYPGRAVGRPPSRVFVRCSRRHRRAGFLRGTRPDGDAVRSVLRLGDWGNAASSPRRRLAGDRLGPERRNDAARPATGGALQLAPRSPTRLRAAHPAGLPLLGRAIEIEPAEGSAHRRTRQSGSA